MKSPLLPVFAAYLGLLVCLPSHAQDEGVPVIGLSIGGSAGDTTIPIALPYPVGAGQNEYWSTVKRDLELSGWFTIIDPKAYLEAAGTGVHPGEFSFDPWKTTGAAALAKTTYSDGRAEVWVYDVSGQAKLEAKAFSSTSSRALAHKTANTIIEAITHTRGFFDTRIAFTGNFSGNKEVYIMDADGQGRRQVTKNKSINLSPKWNSAGSSLCFTSYSSGNPDLYVADLGKGQIRRISSRSGLNMGCGWAPGGGAIALTLSTGADSELYTIDPVAGRQIARLTSAPGIDVSPSYSPDGSKIAFVSERGGGPQIYVMNSNGTGAHRVSFQGSYNVSPSWSPKGDKIAYVTRSSGFDVFVMNTDGSGVTRISDGAGDNEDPSFSPEGDYVAYSSTRTGSAHIWISTADGRKSVRITEGGGGYTNPHWSTHLNW